MKKRLSLFLAILVFLCVGTQYVSAYEELLTDDKVFYLYRTETRSDALILDYNSDYINYSLRGTIVIPSKIKGYAVKGIDERGFFNCINMESVVIPNTVTIIREEAFIGCSNLKKVTIPKSVTKIENYAFFNTSITDVYYEGNENDWNNIDMSGIANADLVYAPSIHYGEDVKTTGISLDQNSISLYKGKTQTLIATVEPYNATNKNITWSSSNTSVATVDTKGKVTAKSIGTATITVKTVDGGYKAQCTVQVKPVAVEGININKNWDTMIEGERMSLSVTVSPSNAENKNIIWSSSDKSVVAVTTVGDIIAQSAGEATITATTEDGGFSATCNITVIENTENLIYNNVDNTFKTTADGIMIFAEYDNDILLNTTIKEVSKNDTVDFESLNDYKAMLWGGYENMKPLSDVVFVKASQNEE